MPWSPAHTTILSSTNTSLLVTGVPGSGKTELLVRTAVKDYLKGRNVLVITLVSAVRDELAVRINALLPRPLRVIGSSHKLKNVTLEKIASVLKKKSSAKEMELLSSLDLIDKMYNRVDNLSGSLQLSTIDGMIHQTLMKFDSKWLRENGDRHSLKVRRLLSLLADNKLSEHQFPVMIDGKPADVLLCDELQDVDEDRALLLATLASIGLKRQQTEKADFINSSSSSLSLSLRSNTFKCLAVGDRLQSVFDHAFESGIDSHPFNSWVRVTNNTTLVELPTCFRCPESHIQLVNFLMKKYQNALFMSPIVSVKKDTPGCRPIFFAHEPTGKNSGATSAALRVVALVSSYFDVDKTLLPKDVAIVMAKINNSAVMGTLEIALEEEFERRFGKKEPTNTSILDVEMDEEGNTTTPTPIDSLKRGKRNYVHYFATEADAARITIKWSRAKDKAALCSVHAIKGRSARLVILLGVTEGAIPREARVHRHVELVDQSILNVGLTRSTQYLAIGFAFRRPSRYLYDVRGDLQKFAALTWDSTIDDQTNVSRNSLPLSLDPVEMNILRGFSEKIEAIQLDNLRPDWSFAASTYLLTESGRPEHLLFPVRLLADRNQKLCDGDEFFDPSKFYCRYLPGTVPVAFPASFDTDDDLIACITGVMGELGLCVAMKSRGLSSLTTVINALQEGASSLEQTTSLLRLSSCNFDVIYTNDSRALAAYWDLGVNERIASGQMNMRSWTRCVNELELSTISGSTNHAYKVILDAYSSLDNEKEDTDIDNVDSNEHSTRIGGAFDRPVLMVDSQLRDTSHALLHNFKSVLETLQIRENESTNVDDDSIAKALWGAAVIKMLLTQRVRRPRMAELINECPDLNGGWWSRLRRNIIIVANELTNNKSEWEFGQALELSTEEDDRKVMDEMTIDPSRESIRIGVAGFCDAYCHSTRTLLEVKVGFGSIQRLPATLWTVQSITYSAMKSDEFGKPFSPIKLIIVDLGSGSCWTHSGSPFISLSNTSISNPPNPVSSLQISSRLFLKKVLLRERYRKEHIDKILRFT